MTQSTEVPVERVAWPGNGPGLRKKTVPTMAKFIRRRAHDPRFRALAGQILRDAGFPKTIQAKCEALRLHVKSVTDYANDPFLAEYVQDPEYSLCLPDAAMCAPLIDCDDGVPTVDALIGAAGMQPFILLLEYGGGAQIHVMGGVKDEKGSVLEVDVTTDKPVGSKSWSKTRTVVDPFDSKMLETGEFAGGEFVGAGKAFDGTVRPVDPALHLVGAGAATPGDVLSYRALWDDYVLQTVCAYNVLAWALGFLIQGQSPPNTIDVTAPSIAGIPYCVRTIPTWNYALPLVDTSQFGDNPPTVAELTSVQTAASTSASSLLDRWNVWSNLSDYEIVQDAAQILTSMQGVVSDVGTTERPYLSKYSPSLGAAIVQGPSESTQARIIAQLEGAKIVAGGVLTVFGFGVQGAIDSTATLGQWTAQHAKELGSGVTGLAAFLLSPWTLSIVGLLIVGSVGLAVYNAEKVAKLTSAFKPSLSIGGETKRRKKRRKMAA